MNDVDGRYMYLIGNAVDRNHLESRKRDEWITFLLFSRRAVLVVYMKPNCYSIGSDCCF
jgi:hypothetical protein